jgi:hypothetical protein
MEPGVVPSHTPPGLVGREVFRCPDRHQDALVLGLQAGARPTVDLGTCPTRKGDPEQGPKHGRHFAVGQPGLSVQQGHRGLGVGADLTGRRAQRVGCLERVPPLGPTPAVGTVPQVNGELADQRGAWDLGLELLGGAGLDERAAAVRARVGQWGLVTLGDRSGRQRPVPMRAVCLPGLASGFFGAGLGRSLAKRSRLAFADACGLLQLPGQFGDPGFEFGQPLEVVPAAGTRGLVHAGIVAGGGGKSPFPVRGR